MSFYGSQISQSAMAWRPWAAFWALVASCVAASEPSAQHGAPLRKSVLAAERERVGPALRARMLRPGGGEVPARTVEYLQLRPERRRELEDGTAAPSALPTPAPSALPSVVGAVAAGERRPDAARRRAVAAGLHARLLPAADGGAVGRADARRRADAELRERRPR
ncbi:hypothetical protein JL721_10129 [Aureococcus anophagefferens]|nr:hypothetical protein JL721_10129 [Aureococcus anophagefferens]